ncbi:hypothetical protein MNBD_GAMMA11-2644 [hydrothermal vent metagenome]|uniref:Toxin HigB n=1 Tax=hydrothermal vent metagenome TaxID=652676 RepID=A0A3B0X4E1_9ZZZZ
MGAELAGKYSRGPLKKEEYSIRINEQYRIFFKWSESGPLDVEITDYH